MKQRERSLLTIVNIASLLSSIYYFTIGIQYTIGFICGGIFLFAFVTAIQLTPTPPKTCPHCGKDLEKKG